MNAVAGNNSSWNFEFNGLGSWVSTVANVANVVDMIPGGTSTLKAARLVGGIGARLIPGVGWGLMAMNAYNVASYAVEAVSAKYFSDNANGKNTKIVMDSKMINPAMAGNVAMGAAGDFQYYNESPVEKSRLPVVINQNSNSGSGGNAPDPNHEPDDDDELKKSERERKIAENRAATVEAEYKRSQIEKELKEGNKGWFRRNNKLVAAFMGAAAFVGAGAMIDDNAKTPDASPEATTVSNQAANPIANDRNIYMISADNPINEYLEAAGIDGSKGINRATLEFFNNLEGIVGQAVDLAEVNKGKISPEKLEKLVEMGGLEIAKMSAQLGNPLKESQAKELARHIQEKIGVAAGFELITDGNEAPSVATPGIGR